MSLGSSVNVWFIVRSDSEKLLGNALSIKFNLSEVFDTPQANSLDIIDSPDSIEQVKSEISKCGEKLKRKR